MKNWNDIDNDLFMIENLTEEKAFEIIIGERKEASIVKAIHDNYAMQISYYRRYSPYLPMLFIRYIKDTKICVKLLELKIYKTSKYNHEIEKVLKFLLLKYTDSEILDFFLSIKPNDFKSALLFSKLLFLLKKTDDLAHFFILYASVKCTLTDLYNALIDYHRSTNTGYMKGVEFDLTSKQLERCSQIDNYDVKIIQNGDELLSWSNHLLNDIYLDFNDIANNKTSVYGFFKYNNLEFIVKVGHHCSILSLAFRDAMLNSEQENSKEKWISKFFSPKKEYDPIPIEIVY